MNPKFKPSKPFFRYLKTEYAKEVHGYQSYNFSDEMQEKLLKTAYALTAYFKSKKGAKIVFATAGVEEVKPHHGFDYRHDKTKRLVPDTKNLRIFRKVTKERTEFPKTDLEIIRKVFYSENWTYPLEDFIMRVFRHYRNWFSTGLGQTWIYDNYKAIEYLKYSNGIGYRYQTDDGRVYWFDDSEIIPESKPLDYCINCDSEYPCTDHYTGMGTLCNRCFSEHFADPESLKSCNRHECRHYGCHNYLTEMQFYELVENPHNMPVRWANGSVAT